MMTLSHRLPVASLSITAPTVSPNGNKTCDILRMVSKILRQLRAELRGCLSRHEAPRLLSINNHLNIFKTIIEKETYESEITYCLKWREDCSWTPFNMCDMKHKLHRMEIFIFVPSGTTKIFTHNCELFT